MPRVSNLTLARLRTTKFKFRVDSKCVADISYDVETETLTIEFQQRGTYIYRNFPLDEYVDFETASSRGQYFNNYIRNSGYEYERIS